MGEASRGKNTVRNPLLTCNVMADSFALASQMFKEGQRILERQRFQFPSSWLHSDNIEGEWSAFNDILRRKNDSIQTQVTSAFLQKGFCASARVCDV